MQSKLQQARHMKWMSYIQQFNIVIKYKKGATNKLAYMLSWCPIITKSTLLVAIKNQPTENFECTKGYSIHSDFCSEFQLKDGPMHKGT